MSAICQPTAQSSGGGRVILWIDAQLSLALACWISDMFGLVAHRDLSICRQGGKP